MPALITFEYLSFGTISFDRMGRASCQMRIAAAFAAPNGSNEFLILDDEGTPFHSPARNQHPRGLCNLAKRAELGWACRKLWKNWKATISQARKPIERHRR